MPTNVQMERCISRERDALVFSAPDAAQRKAGCCWKRSRRWQQGAVGAWPRQPS